MLKESEPSPSADPDVLAEQDKLQGRCEAYVSRQRAPDTNVGNYAVEMFGLKKLYKRSGLFSRKKPFIAVEGNWLGIQEGMLCAMIGSLITNIPFRN